MTNFKLSKILFIFSITGIILLLILVQTTKETKEGIIKSIDYSNNKITISLENKNESLVIFENKFLPLKEKDKIIYEGKEETYKGQKQIIIDKIILSSNVSN